MYKKLIKKLFGNKQEKTVVMDKEIAADNLADACRILASLQIRSWLTDGTLLGYYRENDFIAHDMDVDIGCFISEHKDSLIPEFKKSGWICKRVYGTVDAGLEMTMERHGVRLDIFFFYEEADTYWHGAWLRVDKKTRNLIKYVYQKFELQETTFYNQKFLIPADPLAYIIQKYGEKWETPTKNWHWAFDPFNAIKTDIMISDKKTKRM